MKEEGFSLILSESAKFLHPQEKLCVPFGSVPLECATTVGIGTPFHPNLSKNVNKRSKKEKRRRERRQEKKKKRKRGSSRSEKKRTRKRKERQQKQKRKEDKEARD